MFPSAPLLDQLNILRRYHELAREIYRRGAAVSNRDDLLSRQLSSGIFLPFEGQMWIPFHRIFIAGEDFVRIAPRPMFISTNDSFWVLGGSIIFPRSHAALRFGIIHVIIVRPQKEVFGRNAMPAVAPVQHP